MKKKLNLENFLVRQMLPMLIIGIIVGTIANLVFCLAASIYAASYQQSRYAVTVSEIYAAVNMDNMLAELNGAELSDEGLYNRFAYSLAWTSDYELNSSYSVAYSVKNFDTGEVVATSECRPYAVIIREHRPMHLESITEVIPCGSEEFIGLCRKYSGQAEYVSCEIEDIYIKDGKFYPGKVTVYKLDSVFGEFTDVLEAADFTPENPEEYERADEFYWNYIGTKDAEIMSMVANGDPVADESGLFNSSWQLLETSRGNYSVTMCFEYNFWADHSDTTIIIFSSIIILSLIVGTITAAVSYNQYSKQYALDEYRRTMTNALAHDLKSPLTAIYGYAENLKNNIHSEKKDYYADAVLENVRYMNEIITGTLELSRLENADGIKAESVDIASLAHELCSKYRPQAEARGISVKLTGKCTANANRKLISQAMENLISNAIKYTPDGGEIEIISDESFFTVSNTCDENLKGDTEALCEPFSKKDESRSNRKGSGIGLSIVKNIAALHKFGFSAKADNGIFTAKIVFKKK